MKARQSFLASSFAPIRPIVQTATAFTQTDSEPLKVFSTTDTQTDSITTTAAKTQTENAEMKSGTTQTAIIQTNEESMQTDKKIEIDQSIQVQIKACDTAEIEIQTSDLIESSENFSEYSEEQLRKKEKGISISIGDEGGSGAANFSHAQTAKANKRPVLDF